MLDFTKAANGYSSKFETEHFQIHVIAQYTPFWSRKTPAKVRVYVSGADEVSTEGLEYTTKGEDPEMDAAWRKVNRQELVNMRAVVSESLEEVEELDFLVGRKLNWSRTAGCSCGCSPAFIAQGDSVVVEIPVQDSDRKIPVRIADVFVSRKTAE